MTTTQIQARTNVLRQQARTDITAALETITGPLTADRFMDANAKVAADWMHRAREMGWPVRTVDAAMQLVCSVGAEMFVEHLRNGRIA